MRNKKIAAVKPEYCIKCGHCGSVCPSKAIVVPSVESRKAPAPGTNALPSPRSLQLLLRSRRSVRRYKRKPLTKKDLNTIIEAGRYTATGSNSQNIRYIVVTHPRKIAELREILVPAVMKLFATATKTASLPFASYLLGDDLADRLRNQYAPGMKIFHERQMRGEDRLFFNAPAIMLVCSDRWDETSGFSSAAALYNCSLMAHTIGVGCCFNGFIQSTVNNNARIRKWFGIPWNQKCYGAMILGYQDVEYDRLVKRKEPDVTWL
jgi:nitroreductase